MSAADTFLPLIVADAMRPDLTPEEEEKAEKEGKVRAFSNYMVIRYSNSNSKVLVPNSPYDVGMIGW